MLQLTNNLAVRRLGFGAMQLPGPGVWGPPPDRDNAVAVLRKAVALGVNHIDTSASYGPHIANELIRTALYPYPDELVIATKVGVVRDEQHGFAAAAKPAQLRQQVEENLARLGRDRLDLVYLRVGGDGLLAPDEVPFSESFAAMIDLRGEGLIGELGLSGVTVDQLAAAREMAPVVAVQNRFHLFDRSSSDVLAACEKAGIAFVGYFPLAAGMLRPGLDLSQAPPGMAPSSAGLAALDQVAARYEATRAQVAIGWLLGHSQHSLAIPGTASVAHLAENMAAVDLALSTADMTTLDSLAGPG